MEDQKYLQNPSDLNPLQESKGVNNSNIPYMLICFLCKSK